MKKLLTAAMVVALIFVFGSVFADSLPASKNAAKVGNVNILHSTAKDWSTILSQYIKTSQQKDLFVGVSLETGLYTQTLVKSSGGIKDTSTSTAGVMVKVLVDGVPAKPAEVVFDRRFVSLSATLQGIIGTTDGVLDPTKLTPEEIELVLDTMSAHSFNFILTDVGVGTHKIDVQARVLTDTTSMLGSAGADASIGNGSVTIEEVRLIKYPNIDL